MKQKQFLFSIILAIFGFTITAQDIQIKVDATKTSGKLEPFWASQIIHPTEFVLTEWGTNFVRLLKETGAAQQYIRIYNQPENAIRIGSDGKITYNWNRFDEMAELILSTGNKLKVIFFSMPFELALYPESVKHRPDIGVVCCISPPKDYKLWEELCADFTRHVIDKFGLDEVKKWTFRCWNEPDHTGFWHNGDINEYLKLYDYFAKGVKSVNPGINIGGPALTSTATYIKPENFKLFLEHVVNGVNHATGKTGSPIDFISVHTYGGVCAGGAPGKELPDVDYLIEQQIRYADMRDEYPKLRNLPIHVEEWGESSCGTTGVSEKPTADVRNSQYGAAFLTSWVGRHILLKQEKDRKIESFTFCSSGYDRVPVKDFMGYRTLDTKNGFHKPVLNAYKLLYRLAPELVPVTIVPSNRHISAFATRDADRITIVVTNYQYDQIINNGISYPLNLSTQSQWKPETKITVKHWRIDNTHSNSYSAFKEIGSPELPNQLEIDSVKKRMNLELMEPPKHMMSRDLDKMKFELPCNAVSLIEITRD